MSVRPLFLNGPTGRLFAMRYAPASAPRGGIGVLHCPALGEGRLVALDPALGAGVADRRQVFLHGGELRTQYAHSIDIVPTILDAIGLGFAC